MADHDDNAVTDSPDFLNMSDDELANFDPTSLASEPEEEVDTDPHGAQAAASVASQGGDTNEEEGAGDEDGEGTSKEEGSTDSTDAAAGVAESDEAGKTADQTAQADAGKAVKADPAKTADLPDASGTIDYKAAYERLTAPFKANGRDIQVKDVDEAVALMQMGANYNKKMAGLKPNLKLMKMLEANGLLDEAKLSFLIDLDKRDPAAINKLVLDSKIDPLDLSADKADGYKVGNHRVDDRSMELDDVLSELESSSGYNRTLEVVATKWDQASKEVISVQPQILKVINGHIESGIYDRIASEIERERTFGRLGGLSDIDAYQQVGDAMQKRGAFNDLFQGSSQGKPKLAPADVIVVEPKLKQADEDKLKEQKRKAAAPKAAAPGKSVPADFNPLNVSDDEFAKIR